MEQSIIAEPEIKPANRSTISNFEKWRIYTDGLTAPNSFINFGYFYLISSALQRRVWCPPSHKPIFLNQFMTFVAPPGVGKGLVTSEITKFLRYHKLTDPSEKTTTVNGDETGAIQSVEKGVDVDRQVIEASVKADFLSALAEEQRGPDHLKKYAAYEKPLLIPVASDASTYEALVIALGRSLRRKNYAEYDEKLGRNIIKIYTHSSICFCLEEITSLFKRKTEDVVYFLQQTYDCGDYKKDTKTQGVDRVQKSCVNLLGGTTPETMRKIFKDGLLNEGYASRSIFLYEHKDRKTAVFIPELNAEQKQYQQDILDHIKKLTNLYGQVYISPEAENWLEEWWKRCQTIRPNISDRLQDYYARKKVHAIKMAAAIHFSESTAMEITLPEFQLAVKMLDEIEIRMHHALIPRSENPYYKLGVKVITFLTDTQARTEKELLAKFWEDLPTNDPRDALRKVLDHFMIIGKINSVTDKKGITKYDVIRVEQIGETYDIRATIQDGSRDGLATMPDTNPPTN